MVSPSVLPYELLYCIMDVFDAASPEGRRSLFACSYANRALSTICQERLFRDVEISYRLFRDDNFHLVFHDDERTTGHKFLDFLAGSPHIGSYVQNFTINAMKPTGRPMSFASSGLSDTSSNTPSFSLYKIVPRLRNLKGFVITHTDGYYFCHWNAVEQRTKTFFISIVPLLTKIDLYLFVHLPLSMFSNSTNLEELRVSYLDMDREDVTSPSVSKVKLQALEVGYPAGERESWAPWFNTPRLPLDVSKLRKLKLSDPYCPVLDIDETLKLCSETLEELDFHLAIYANTGQTPNLGLLRNLRHLTIHISIHSRLYHPPPIEELDTDLLHVATTLKTLPFDAFVPMQLRLTLQTTVFYLSDFDNSLPLVPGWSDLISVLDGDQMSPFFVEATLMFQRFEFDRRPVHISMPLSALTRIMDENEGLKKLRKKGVMTYACY